MYTNNYSANNIFYTTGWLNVSIPNILSNKYFWIGFKRVNSLSPYITTDIPGVGRSYFSTDSATWNPIGPPYYGNSGDLMIRAIVSEGNIKDKGGIISTTPGTQPFYTTSPQPQTCLNMQANNTCNLTWNVNATGALGLYKFFGIFNSSLPLAQKESSKVNITIVNETIPTEIISMTLTGYSSGILFGSLNPGTQNNSAQGNGNYIVTIDSSTNVDVDIYHKGTNFTNSSNTININNMKWHNFSNVNNAYIMQTSYGTDKIANVLPGTNISMYYWLSIPSGQAAASNYQSQITIKAVKTGNNPDIGGSSISQQSQLNEPQSSQQETQSTKTQGGASVNIIKLN